MLSTPTMLSVCADSYKASHHLMFPEADEMTAYGTFRKRFAGINKTDDRFVFYGMRYVVESYISRKWTVADVEAAEQFYTTHNAGFTKYPFPKELFLSFIAEFDGYFPVRIEALPEGSVAHIGTPCFTITASGKYAPLCTYLETVLTMVWYPSTVATLSRYVRDIITDAYEQSVDEDAFWTLDSRLHDFGFRGTSCIEQSMLGGSAHLLSFSGSDTLSAAYFVQYSLNEGRPVATSVPATEHSVMTAWASEEAAVLNAVEALGHGVISCVMDSYDYNAALENILPKVAPMILSKGGHFVIRPDSGDPTEAVLAGLDAAAKCFGFHANSKGYKVLHNASVLQGDGINFNTIRSILDAVLARGYSAQNVLFGMGGGLLMKVNRDTMSFATKLCHLRNKDGSERMVMKHPKSVAEKSSLPGLLSVVSVNGSVQVYPKEDCPIAPSCLEVVYDNGPVHSFANFDVVRERLQTQWSSTPQIGSPISTILQAKIHALLV